MMVRLKISLMLVMLVLLFAVTACSALDRSPMEPLPTDALLSCSNVIPTPAPAFTLYNRRTGATVTGVERIVFPLHFADTLRIFTAADSADSKGFQQLAAVGGARVIFPHPGRCTTLSDSLVIHAQLFTTSGL